MNRFLKKTFATGVVMALLAIAHPLLALDISVGGNVWYAWWKPAWLDNNTSKGQPGRFLEKIYVDRPDYNWSGSFLYGPVLSLRIIDTVSISSAFVTGEYRSRCDGALFGYDDDYDTRINYLRATRSNKKYDSDTTISYNITTYLKIFTGFKFQGYDFEYSVFRVSKLLSNRIVMTAGGKSQVRNYGPGMGLGLNINLIENFYLLSNVSCLVLWGSERMVLDNMVSAQGFVAYTHFKKGVFLSYGANASISFAYHIARIHTTLSLGGRYQVLKYHQKAGDRGFTNFNGEYDHFFGVTFSAVYTFNIPIKKKTQSPELSDVPDTAG